MASSEGTATVFCPLERNHLHRTQRPAIKPLESMKNNND